MNKAQLGRRFQWKLRLPYVSLITLLAATLLIYQFYGKEDSFGSLSLLPTAVVLIISLITHRTLEALIAGSLTGFLMISPQTALQDFSATALEVMQDPTTGWIFLVCGLFGSLIALLQFSGGTLAFSDLVGRYCRTRRKALIFGWLLGILIFIDDYLNALTVSTAMRKLTDKLKISREMLAYLVDSTAAPVCLLIPFSTWVIYLAGLLESNGLAEAGGGFSFYLELLPYLFYPWIAVILVPLVISGIIPPLGAMKQAEQNCSEQPVNDESDTPDHVKPRMINFVLPMLTLILSTWYFDIDALMGIGCALLVTLGLYSIQRIAPFARLFDELMAGIESMLVPLGIIFIAFILQVVNEKLGLAPYLIESVTPYMDAQWLPALTFLLLAALAFSTGTFWGVYAIALPIVVPLAQSLEANMPLTLGALISAGAFGSHACFFGDATVISAKGCGITPMQHAVTQLPYVLIAAGLSFLLFLFAA